MDEQTLSFLELTAMDDLVQLVADKRAAWLWSADGARILWANAAGASFFSAQSVADLANLTSLERSPARPHIARIAESGPTDKFSIDRLRFYRGLRVMLLTCAVPAFAQILRADDATVFVTDAGSVEGCFGELKGTPEDLDLPDGQTALFGPLELDGDFHEGVVLKVTDSQKLVVLENLPLADPDTEAGEESPESAQEADASAIEAGLLATGVAAGAAVAAETSSADEETASRIGEDDAGWVRADEDEFETADDMAATQAAPAPPVEEPVEDDLDDLAAREQSIAAGVVTSDDISPMDAGEADLEAALSDLEEIEEDDGETAEDISADAEEGDGLEEIDLEENVLEETTAKVMAEDTSDDAAMEGGDGFVFQPRRRPVRFAWKMDIDQRFTFRRKCPTLSISIPVAILRGHSTDATPGAERQSTGRFPVRTCAYLSTWPPCPPLTGTGNSKAIAASEFAGPQMPCPSMAASPPARRWPLSEHPTLTLTLTGTKPDATHLRKTKPPTPLQRCRKTRPAPKLPTCPWRQRWKTTLPPRAMTTDMKTSALKQVMKQQIHRLVRLVPMKLVHQTQQSSWQPRRQQPSLRN